MSSQDAKRSTQQLPYAVKRRWKESSTMSFQSTPESRSWTFRFTAPTHQRIGVRVPRTAQVCKRAEGFPDAVGECYENRTSGALTRPGRLEFWGLDSSGGALHATLTIKRRGQYKQHPGHSVAPKMSCLQLSSSILSSPVSS